MAPYKIKVFTSDISAENLDIQANKWLARMSKRKGFKLHSVSGGGTGIGRMVICLSYQLADTKQKSKV